MAESRPLGVKSYTQIFGIFFFHEPADRLDESIYGICGKSFGIRKIADGIIRTVEKRISVNEKNFVHLRIF